MELTALETMQNFITWLLPKLAQFLMSEPIIYFTAIWFIAYLFASFGRLFRSLR